MTASNSPLETGASGPSAARVVHRLPELWRSAEPLQSIPRSIFAGDLTISCTRLRVKSARHRGGWHCLDEQHASSCEPTAAACFMSGTPVYVPVRWRFPQLASWGTAIHSPVRQLDRTFLGPTADVGDRWPLKGDRWSADDEWALVDPRRCWQLFRAWLGYDVPLPSLSSSAPAESFPRGIFTGPVNTNADADVHTLWTRLSIFLPWTGWGRVS